MYNMSGACTAHPGPNALHLPPLDQQYVAFTVERLPDEIYQNGSGGEDLDIHVHNSCQSSTKNVSRRKEVEYSKLILKENILEDISNVCKTYLFCHRSKFLFFFFKPIRLLSLISILIMITRVGLFYKSETPIPRFSGEKMINMLEILTKYNAKYGYCQLTVYII